MRRLRTVFVWLVATLVPGGCVSLTPAEEHAVAEVRAIADDTARVYFEVAVKQKTARSRVTITGWEWRESGQ